MDLEITPYVGVGPFKFGMTSVEVSQALGNSAPKFTREEPGSLREMYVGDGYSLSFTYEPAKGKNDCAAPALKLVEVGLSRQNKNLTYRGIKLFAKRKDALRRLLEDDPAVGETVGFLVFPNLGITLTGFHEGPKEDLAVTAFTRGHWDDEIQDLNPYP